MAETTSAPGGNPPDEETIKLDSQKKLFVSYNDIILGDFEDQNFGGWTDVSGNNNINSNNALPENSYYLTLNAYSSDAVIERTIDFSKGNNLSMFLRGDGDLSFNVKIGNNTVLNGENPPTNWTKYTFDVSNFSSEEKLVLDLKSTVNGGNELLRVDEIRLQGGIKSIMKIIDNNSGGTNLK